MLSAPELRKLIRAHNELSKIKVPRGATADDLVKLIEANGYTVNHEQKKIKENKKVKRGKQITLKQADQMFPAPKKKTQSEKDEAKKKSRENLINKVIKNKEILSDERIKNLL